KPNASLRHPRRTRPIRAAARLTPAKGIEGTQPVGAAVRSEDCQRRSLRGDAAAHSGGVTVGRRAMITDSRVAAERARGARRCPTGVFSTTAGVVWRKSPYVEVAAYPS